MLPFLFAPVSGLVSVLVSLLIIAVVVYVIVLILNQIPIPPQFKTIVYLIIFVALLIFLLHFFGLY